MGTYSPYGASDIEYLEYQKLRFLKKNIESIDEEALSGYSVMIEKLYRWIMLAIELRMEDIISRRDHIEQLKHEREQAIVADGERTARYEAAHTEAVAVWEEKIDAELAKEAENEEEGEEGVEKEEPERPPFDEDAFNEEFETKDPTIDIPKEVIDDIDNDFNLPYTAPTFEKEAE